MKIRSNKLGLTVLAGGVVALITFIMTLDIESAEVILDTGEPVLVSPQSQSVIEPMTSNSLQFPNEINPTLEVPLDEPHELLEVPMMEDPYAIAEPQDVEEPPQISDPQVVDDLTFIIEVPNT